MDTKTQAGIIAAAVCVVALLVAFLVNYFYARHLAYRAALLNKFHKYNTLRNQFDNKEKETKDREHTIIIPVRAGSSISSYQHPGGSGTSIAATHSNIALSNFSQPANDVVLDVHPSEPSAVTERQASVSTEAADEPPPQLPEPVVTLVVEPEPMPVDPPKAERSRSAWQPPDCSLLLAMAAEVLHAADGTSVNQTRCERLAWRMAALMPLMELYLQMRDNAQADATQAGRGSMIASACEIAFKHLGQTLHDVLTFVHHWELLQANAVLDVTLSPSMHKEYVALAERLKACFNDIGVLLEAVDLPPVHYGNWAALGGVSALAAYVADWSRGWHSDTQVAATAAQRQLLAIYTSASLDLDKLKQQMCCRLARITNDEVGSSCDAGLDLRCCTAASLGRTGLIDNTYKIQYQGHPAQVVTVTADRLTSSSGSSAIPDLRALDSGPPPAMTQQLYLWKHLYHPNIMPMLGAYYCKRRRSLHVLQPFSPNGTLYRRLQTAKRALPWPLRLCMALDVAAGLSYLHSRPLGAVVLGRLSSQQLWLGEEDRVMISVPGVSSSVGQMAMTHGTLSGDSAASLGGYVAPEVLQGEAVTCASDVYSFGMILAELIAGKDSLADMLSSSGTSRVLDGVPESVEQCLKACLEQQPSRRPGMLQVLDLLDVAANEL